MSIRASFHNQPTRLAVSRLERGAGWPKKGFFRVNPEKEAVADFDFGRLVSEKEFSWWAPLQPEAMDIGG
ncbi:MAG: hypothetical protein AB1847_21230 [bacterium]